ncbi:SIS domain-containing protein [Streptacidiphilus sp. P02-A3a]|uniref:SIS domain-containing protein n=1 Tax=Streptacidiphilus sp. P02-A3a TaxID=2704468 RepID=UPI0015FCEADB|nr:SIS domain-containing protein [Streptacidiphilus sp. P02-A3a]QMU71354.1 SIS domain-containing protein [Streptacidiphilus sp. P02-A3a]
MSGTRIPFLTGQANQPQALERVVATLRRQLDAASAEPLRRARRPLFTGIGASYAALAVPVQLLRDHGVVSQRVLASEIVAGTAGFDVDLLVGVSQGGRSSETVAAFQRAGAARLPRAALLNVTDSPLGGLAETVLDLGNEPDSYASTIGFTGTVVALDLIAGAIAGRAAADDPWSGIAESVRAVRARAAEVVAGLRERAARCVAADVVAAGASRASAEEGALLLREVVRMPASAGVTRNYLHGEMESAGGTLHLVLGDGREVELARSLAAAGHLTLLVTTGAVEPAARLGVVRLPEAAAAARVVLETVVVQELVVALSEERGVPIETFVFANADTKEGGVDQADFTPVADH